MNIFNHFRFEEDTIKHLKKCSTKEEFAERISRELFYYFVSAQLRAYDCRIGIDINSYVATTYEKELDGIEDDYITKFVQVFEGKLSMDTYTLKKKVIFNNWIKGEHLCVFIKEYRRSGIIGAELNELLILNYDVLYELFLLLIKC